MSTPSRWRVTLENIGRDSTTGVGLLAFVVLLTLGLAAVSIADGYGDNTCVGDYVGISFNYSYWLLVYGGVSVAIALLFGLLTGWSYCLPVTRNSKANAGYFIHVGLVRVLVYVFQFSWFITGAVLYFEEVNASCASGEVSHARARDLLLANQGSLCADFFLHCPVRRLFLRHQSRLTITPHVCLLLN
jgi:hypothetical protein